MREIDPFVRSCHMCDWPPSGWSIFTESYLHFIKIPSPLSAGNSYSLV